MAQISHWHDGLFHDDELTYSQQLEKCAKSLRNSAINITQYINSLNNKTKSLLDLKESYNKIESMPVKDLCSGIEEIKSNLLKVEFLSKSKSINRETQNEFVRFFELQNEFNAEVNAFVKKVIQLEIIG
jgi:hypothetical protein